MITLLADVFVMAGVGVLISALLLVRQLIVQLPPGRIRRRWYTMTGLIILFIIGYICYYITFWNHHIVWLDLIVPAIFFFGAGFVWLTATLSLQTATDVRRVTLLEHENITDPLIGIYNRRYLDRRLEEECARAQRYALPLSLILIDVDHFKVVNDTYGHQAGDLVLGYLGKLLLQVIRESDIAARYGGDEILIIAPKTNINFAAVLAERLRQHVETHALVLTNTTDKPQEIYITVSIGVASLTEEINDCQKLILKVDEVLFCAKQEGRNRIIAHGIKSPKVRS